MPLGGRPRSLRRLVLYLFLTLALVAGLLADLFTLDPLPRPDTPLPRPPRSFANTDLNPFGVNIFLDREVADWKKRRTIEMISEAGIGWIKQQFSWAEIEPRQGYFWDDKNEKPSWEKFDRIVDLAEEYGLEVIARLDRPPAWARPEGSNPEAPPADPHTYADFVFQFVQHYRGRIHYIQLWNEPNLEKEWRWGAPVDPQAYATLLRLAYRRAREADPNVQVLSAPLAARLTDDPDRLNLSELTYLEEMYRAGAAPYFDIMSANGYGFSDPPEAPPDPGRMNFRRVELLRLIMEKHSDGGKAVWFNEYGWNTAPANFPPEDLIWGRVSEQEQAEYTPRGIAYAREHWPWAGVICIWYFRWVGDLPAKPAESYFRMVNDDFTPQPVYAAVRQVATALATASPGWYEEMAAPVQYRGDWYPVHDGGASDGSYIASGVPGSHLVLTFQGSDLRVRVRRGPDGGRFLVSVDGVSGRGTVLPRDRFGMAYLDLYSPDVEWVEVPLVQGLGREFPARLHRLELNIAEEKSASSSGHFCALDSFEVGYQRSYRLLGISAGLLLAGLLAALTILVLEFLRAPAPRPQAVPVNPWTLQPDQFPPSGEAPPSPPPKEP